MRTASGGPMLPFDSWLRWRRGSSLNPASLARRSCSFSRGGLDDLRVDLRQARPDVGLLADAMDDRDAVLLYLPRPRLSSLIPPYLIAGPRPLLSFLLRK